MREFRTSGFAGGPGWATAQGYPSDGLPTTSRVSIGRTIPADHVLPGIMASPLKITAVKLNPSPEELP